MTTPNKGLIFKKAPHGWPNPDTDLAVETRKIDLSKAPNGGLIVKNHYVSFDPYQRGRMRAPEKKSYSAPFTLGDPITNRGIVTVVASDHATWKKGDVLIVDGTGTEEYSTYSEEFTKTRMLRKLENPHHLDPKVFIGALGMPGLTAYSSLYEIGQPKKGETIFINAASGAVGALVGQLAKREGLKVIGSVGDDEKLKYIKEELGFDDGFNYKKEKPDEALARLAPGGIDIYYENVGGEQLEAAINHMNNWGRIGKLMILLTMFCVMLILSSCLWHDFPIQRQAR
jgi:NADPH-dependent curcumin reductase CurA